MLMKVHFLIFFLFGCFTVFSQQNNNLTGEFGITDTNGAYLKVLRLCDKDFGLSTDYKQLVRSKYDMASVGPLEFSGGYNLLGDTLISITGDGWQVDFSIIDSLNIRVYTSNLDDLSVGECFTRGYAFFNGSDQCVYSNSHLIRWSIDYENVDGVPRYILYTMDPPGGYFFEGYKSRKRLPNDIYKCD